MGRSEAGEDAARAAADLELVQRRYDRIAPVYDAFEWMMELRARRWRRQLWAGLEPGRVLELGVGTGKNFPYYPPGVDVVGNDISPRMLAIARRRADRRARPVQLELGDAQALTHADASFDAVVGTFVFCSIPSPRVALAEALRVLRPGGELRLLEHVLSRRGWLAAVMRWLDPIPSRLWGAHIDRQTDDDVREVGFVDVTVAARSLDVVIDIRARRPVST